MWTSVVRIRFGDIHVNILEKTSPSKKPDAQRAETWFLAVPILMALVFWVIVGVTYTVIQLSGENWYLYVIFFFGCLFFFETWARRRKRSEAIRKQQRYEQMRKERAPPYYKTPPY
jgi:small-conductance mechanosensitive channel